MRIGVVMEVSQSRSGTLVGPSVRGRSARLRLHLPRGSAPARAAVLVLHGGRARSEAPTSRMQLAYLRMIPFDLAVRRATAVAGLQVATARLRYRVRGWNGRAQDPVQDARWALDELRARLGPVPVVLLGHSLGGRTALALAATPRVVGVVGLAPWVEGHDPVRVGDDVRVDVLHGTADRMTDPHASEGWTARAGALASFTPVPGAGHAMLQRPGYWHRTAAGFAVDDLRAALDHSGPAAGQDVHVLGSSPRRQQS